MTKRRKQFIHVKDSRKKEDIYDKCEKVGDIDIDGEYRGDGEQIGFFPDYQYGHEEEEE